MKKNTLQILLMFVIVVLMVSGCVMLFGCSDIGENTRGPVITIGTSPIDTTGNIQTTGSSTTDNSTTGVGPEPTSAPSTTENVQTTAAPETTAKPETTAPILTGDYVNPLTGLPTDENLSNTRPVAIVIDNIFPALARQTGLLSADIVYEGLVAPKITRFMAVYSDYRNTGSVCNVRSGREYNISWSLNHNAVLICHGGAKNTTYDFYQLAVTYFGSRWGFIDTQQEAVYSTATGGEKYKTISGKGLRTDLQYDTISNSSAISAVLNDSNSKFVSEGKGTINGVPRRSFNFVQYGTYPAMSGATTANEVKLGFTCNGALGTRYVSYTYNENSGKYMRYQDNVPHFDAATKLQLSFTNLIVLFTDVDQVTTGIENDPTTIRIATEGSGTGYYFFGGKCIQIVWAKSEVNGSLTINDIYGEAVKLACGNTYIAYLNMSYLASTSYKFWS